MARPANPFHYNNAAVAPNSAKLVYTTATAIPTKFRRTHTDDNDATSPASTSTRFADRSYAGTRSGSYGSANPQDYSGSDSVSWVRTRESQVIAGSGP
jgi:hypothetical protein